VSREIKTVNGRKDRERGKQEGVERFYGNRGKLEKAGPGIKRKLRRKYIKNGKAPGLKFLLWKTPS